MRTSAAPLYHSLEAREGGCCGGCWSKYGSEDATCQSFQRNTIKWASAPSTRMSQHHCLPMQTFRSVQPSDAKTVILPHTAWLIVKSFVLKINALIMSNIYHNVRCSALGTSTSTLWSCHIVLCFMVNHFYIYSHWICKLERFLLQALEVTM